MDVRLFGRALAVQALVVGVPFLVLVALPLPEELFEDYGFAIGPAFWLAGALVSSRLLPAPTRLVMLAALAGLAAGTVVLLVASHDAGGIAALLVFAASCATHDGSERGGTRAPAPAAGRAGAE